jgi:two-component system chemotaxis sensor kinase CheA
MDVVKRQIEQLRGAVSIESTPLKGTAITLTLPLTLAIIDGLLVGVGRDRYVVPLSGILENVELTRTERLARNGRNLVPVRGELIPYLRLRDLFGIHEHEQEVERVVVVTHQGARLGLVVDCILGTHQTVIQSLGRFYVDVTSFSGATIMGDGRVALILNITGLLDICTAGANPAKTSH